MARNKYPEETRQKILDTSRQLFLEKGFDNTSIQDIIDGLGGLTKGVIYHHFKSKEDIFEQVINSIKSKEIEEVNCEEKDGLNGLNKIRRLIINNLRDYERQALGYSARIMLKSPRIIGGLYLTIFSEVIPKVKFYVEEGINDGSIVTEFPEEIAELISLVFNVWLGIQLPNYSREQFEHKIMFIKKTLECLGVPIITDEIVQLFVDLYDYLKIEENN